jgi:hypothetical protein
MVRIIAKPKLEPARPSRNPGIVCCSWEDMAMRNEFFDQIGDMLFAVAIAAAIGLSAANIPIQVNKERAVLAAAAASQNTGQLAYPPPPRNAGETAADSTPPAF